MGPMLGAELAFYLPIGTFAFGLNGGQLIHIKIPVYLMLSRL